MHRCVEPDITCHPCLRRQVQCYMHSQLPCQPPALPSLGFLSGCHCLPKNPVVAFPSWWSRWLQKQVQAWGHWQQAQRHELEHMYMAGTGTDLCSHSYRSACNYTHRYNHLEIPVCRTLAGTLNAFFFLPQGMSSCNANPCVPHCPARLLQIGTTAHLDPGNAILPKMEEAYAKYAQDQERNHNRRDHTLHLDSPVEIGFRSRKLAEVRRAR